MSARSLEIDVRVELGKFRLEIEQEIDTRGVTALFGPSGSGKSTLLRIVAGLETRAKGRVALGDEVWLDSARHVRFPAHRRPVGYMFQGARLFAHLSAEGNLRYAQRRSANGNQSVSFGEVVEALDLEPLLGRRVGSLSGGERQRVALGRTLLTQPRLLLLDEPLAALDPGRKMEILPYVEALHPRFDIPTLYVSHAVDEVALLADRTLVLAHGRVVTSGPTAEILEQLDLQPLNSQGPPGTATVVEARVTHHDETYHLTWLDLAGQTLSVRKIEQLAEGEVARLMVRARDVSLATERPRSVSIRNVLQGTVTDIREDETAAFAEVVVDLGPSRVRARITRASLHELGLEVGSPVFAMLKSLSLEKRARSAFGAVRGERSVDRRASEARGLPAVESR
jgi:molybdate transport system ATP-binding protein